MLKISTPATSANLSVGFDTLGMALDLFNTFTFEESEAFELAKFPKELSSENLVVKSYLDFYQSFGQSVELKKVKITLVKQDIPVSRGLGSSASCILAGVFAANHIHRLEIPFQECVEFAAKLEGHSDNVFACAYGGLTASVSLGEYYHFEQFSVDSSYRFYLMIPSKKGSTKELRDVLPDKVDFTDAVHHLSRTVFVPGLFEQENFYVLKDVLTDKIHEVYRAPYIVNYKQIKALSLEEELIVCISGSGPSLLVISLKDINHLLDAFKENYEIKEVHVGKGISLEVVK